MATLIGSSWIPAHDKLVDAEITIDPVVPTLDGPRDAYRLRLGPNSDGGMLESTLILQGYCDAHNELKFVAEMFREAQGVLTLPQLTVGASRCGVVEETGWADIHLIEASTREQPSRIDVAVYMRDLIRNGPNPAWLQDRCSVLYLRTTVEDAVRFGEDLMGQLIEAWRKRRELGISVDYEDEVWPLYFAEDPTWSACFDTGPADAE